MVKDRGLEARMTAERRILIVDDDEAYCAMLRIALSRDGYGVEYRGGAEEALESIKAAPPDLIILDLMMPKVSGMQLLEYLRSEDATRKIRVVILTARQSQEDPLRCREAGADLFLNKPIDMGLLRESVRKLLTP